MWVGGGPKEAGLDTGVQGSSCQMDAQKTAQVGWRLVCQPTVCHVRSVFWLRKDMGPYLREPAVSWEKEGYQSKSLLKCIITDCLGLG